MQGDLQIGGNHLLFFFNLWYTCEEDEKATARFVDIGSSDEGV